jgi:hypothetical protein
MQTLSTENTLPVNLNSNKINLFPFIACLIYGFFSQYLFLCIVAGLSLTIIVKELWKPNLPLAVLYFFVFQWAQVFTVIPYLDFADPNNPLDIQLANIDLSTYKAQFLEVASLIQLALMAVVVGFFLKRVKGLNGFTLKKAVVQLNTKKVIIAFFISTLIFPFLLAFTRSNPSLNQLIQSFSVIRKVFLILLIFILFSKRDRLNGLIVFILIIEFFLGFTSFFSDFKEVLLYILFVYLTINPKLKPSVLFKTIPLVVFLAFVLIFWSHVKPGYRSFVSGGSKQQVVVKSKGEALGYLFTQLKNFNTKDFKTGTEILLERIETMTLYFKVQERVPSLIPFQEGKNTMSTITFLTLPRSFNPDKEILDPSTKASYYTGIKLATAEEGTSIAMGYFPDFYIDFGIYGMLIPLLLVACFIGWSCKYILQKEQYNMLFNFALLTGAIFSSGTIDSDLTFFLGVFRNYIVLFIIGNWIIFPWINRFIERDDI